MDRAKREESLVDAAYDDVHVDAHKEGDEASFLMMNEIKTIQNPSSSGANTSEANGTNSMFISVNDSKSPLAILEITEASTDAAGSHSTLNQKADETKQHKKSKGVAPIKNLYVSSIAYNIFTITDGAARMIILFHTAALGFDAWDIAIMFSIYEVAGVFINLYAGVAGQIFGLKVVMMMSLVLQLISLILLIIVPSIFGNLSNLSTQQRANVTAYITFAFALGGGAKDFMKLVGKSVPKLVTEEGEEGALFKIVAVLTGAKNSFKGFGFFFGSLLIWGIGYEWSLFVLILLILSIVIPGMMYMDKGLGQSPKGKKPKCISLDVFMKGWNLNILSLARCFLFGSRDVWFEIGAPLFLKQVLGWAPFSAGAFMAGYTIIYGNLQAYSSQVYKPSPDGTKKTRTWKQIILCQSLFNRVPNRSDVPLWAAVTMIEVVVVGIAMYFPYLVFKENKQQGYDAVTAVMLAGLAVFAIFFAINSSIHSYLVVSYSDRDKAAQDIGFYYMANAGGRLFGILLGGYLYDQTVEEYGLSACLWTAGGFLAISTLVATQLRSSDITWIPDAICAESKWKDAMIQSFLPIRLSKPLEMSVKYKGEKSSPLEEDILSILD